MKRLLPCLALAMLAACTTTTKVSEFGSESSQPGKPADSRTRARIHTELAALYFQRGQDAVAVQELKEAIAANAEYAPAYSMLGLVYMDLNENALARTNLEHALKLVPNDSDVNNNYGWFLCQTGSARESIPYFVAAVKNPLYATPQKAWLNAGLCSMRMDDMARAEEYLQRALELDPNLAQGLLNLARLRYKRGKLEDARAYIGRFNKSTDPTAESLWLSLRIEHKLGNTAAEATLAAQMRRAYSGSREYQDFLKGNYE